MPRLLFGGARQRAARNNPVERSRSPRRVGHEGGGGRQRISRAAAAASSATSDVPGPSDGPTVEQLQGFRDNVCKLFLTNKFSAPEAVNLVRSAQGAGAGGVVDLANICAKAANMNNAARDMLRKVVRGARMPQLYWVDVPLYCSASDTAVKTQLPVILPHELFAQIVADVDLPSLMVMSPELRHIHRSICSKLSISLREGIPIGVHGDGVPHQKRKTVEVLSWNFLAEGFDTRFCSPWWRKTFAASAGVRADTRSKR